MRRTSMRHHAMMVALASAMSAEPPVMVASERKGPGLEAKRWDDEARIAAAEEKRNRKRAKRRANHAHPNT